MFESLTSLASAEAARAQIADLFRQHAEWFCTAGRGETYALRRDEMDISTAHGRLMLSCWTEKGSRSWRILGWEWNGQTLLLQASRRLGAELPLIELVPRASALAMAATIRAARQLRCEKLAQLACAAQPQARIERCALNRGTRPGQPGRYARIILHRKLTRIAVTGPVVASQPASVDAFLSSTLLWFKRTADRVAKPPYIEQLWLLVSAELLKPLLYRVALLREGLREQIRVFVVDKDLTTITPAEPLERRELWKKKLTSFPPVPAATIT
ncbi:MAG TPA: hypothetical protein VJS13_12365, partial [Pyrinomonadaceae bacterium]|nr:hypothetical protein [Pyrinomonadaceae bacterium]